MTAVSYLLQLQSMLWASITETFSVNTIMCAGLQVIQPNPANKAVYQEALQRHLLRGKQLFASQ